MKSTEPLRRTKPLYRIDPATGALKERTYRLIVESGAQAGVSVALTKPLIVGTLPDSGLTLDDSSVSRHHVELHPQADGVRVRDLQSTNGTYVAGARVQEALLEGETVLKVGRTALRIQVEEAETVADASPGPTTFGQSVSQSPKMRAVLAALVRVSQSDSTVLLLGETGTGKDILARGIHATSDRRDRPFVVLDCGALSPALVESELFGHAKGAFTGADVARNGAFVAAHGGTLFLDEVGELPLDVQPKLLRALETGTVKPVGENVFRPVDVRIVAATHRNLEAEIEAGRFRRDLYFRLAVIPVQVPPLRDRPEDIPLLIRHFLRLLGADGITLPEDLLERASRQPWPGNARELRNMVERVVAGSPDLLEATPVRRIERQADADVSVPYKEAKEQLVEEFTRAYLTSLSDEFKGNISQMSRKAGIARHHLRELMHRYLKQEGE